MSKKCDHQNLDIKKSAKEFLKLIKHEQFKQTEHLIKVLEVIPRVGSRVAKVLHMKLVDGYMYKKIGEEMGFTATRGRQLYCKGIYMIEQVALKN